jgi:tetratricopeptide (TPR) repeat protein
MHSFHSFHWFPIHRFFIPTGKVLTALNCYEEVVKRSHNEAININPRVIESHIYINVGNLLCKMNELEKGLAMFNQALALDNTHPIAWQNKVITNTSLSHIISLNTNTNTNTNTHFHIFITISFKIFVSFSNNVNREKEFKIWEKMHSLCGMD